MQHFRAPRNPPYKRIYQKTDLNALVCNNAVRLVNKAKSQLFRSILNFKFFLNHVDIVCRPASQPASLP